jgi:hypothetical protein
MRLVLGREKLRKSQRQNNRLEMKDAMQNMENHRQNN